ncbi:MAG: hydroxymethylpyrimidine/phosphomethylpyrimidine kinase [Cypionkella sp.]|uniref:hydroxymethylpyrimidine/phosphomethylpyrimidine kinase n=1 Tax=Cypionkella sp. TaxID=2811411 RepID=UPI002AB88701|nr:hydroxymethylpyrimidine/phosphomethylpyrimidine kinase [Cypionkella sp.]MDZ4310501.1 hydroxymethylpyrimidine/phosphomethylpyrimidine kinase [Cypionkella sp.]
MSRVLIIAGSDPSGGAGMARDLETLALHGVSSAIALTTITVQTDAGVTATHPLAPTLVAAQIAAALVGGVAAVKIGLLHSADIVAAVVQALDGVAAPVVLDPVWRSSSGAMLLDTSGQAALQQALIPRVSLVTPNLLEIAAMPGCAAAAAMLLKGGHGVGVQAVDQLWVAGTLRAEFSRPRHSGTMRGTGCALASAIACRLALGQDLATACEGAGDWLNTRIAAVSVKF